MDELADSTAFALDTASLRERLRSDGYLFFRDVVEPARVQAAYATVVHALQRAGWLSPGDPTAAAITVPARSTDQAHAWQDPGYRAAAASAEVNRIPYLPPVEDVVRRVMGNTAFVYPAKVLRVVYPQAMVPEHGGMHVHQDFGVIGLQDQFTTWIPLMPIPRRLGGLAILPGSQERGPMKPTVLPEDAPGWRTADFRAGDLLIFHCLTAHASVANRSDRFRISMDCRWQLADDPVSPQLVFGPKRDGTELWSRLFGRTGWWHPVPTGLRWASPQREGGRTEVPPSRFVSSPSHSWTRPRYRLAPH
jgi:hypothetical protein